MILVNGTYQQNISATDRALHYGDGVFETIEVINGRAIFILQHMERLEKGCEILGIPFPGRPLLLAEARELAGQSDRAVLKIILSRGSGGRGYQPPQNIKATRLLTLNPYPDYPEDYHTAGIRLKLCEHQLGYHPGLAGIKHLNRLEQVMARTEWQGNLFQEGLMQDMKGNIIEGTMTNVFIVKNGQLFTPLLNLAGVHGIIRQIVLEAATEHGINVDQSLIRLEDVINADEVFVTNSIIGIWPVISFLDREYQLGPVTRHFITWLEEKKQQDLNA